MIGIYAIKNLVSGKMYIGKSINILKRNHEHLYELRRNIHHSEHLQNAYNKYGENVFVFGVVEECNKEDLDKQEKYWIDYYDSYNKGYNCTIPNGYNQGHEWGEQEKIKLSATMREYHSTLSKKKRKDRANHMRSFVDYSKVVHKSPKYSWRLYNKDTLNLEHEFEYTKDFLEFIGIEKRKHVDNKLNRIWNEKGLTYKGFIIIRQGEELNNLLKVLETRKNWHGVSPICQNQEGVLI